MMAYSAPEPARLSAYTLQKLIRQINRSEDARAAWFADRGKVAAQYELSDRETRALLALDVGALYRMGVHALLLRPFTIVHGMSEPDYLKAIRAQDPKKEE
jgi:hypothetical protein